MQKKYPLLIWRLSFFLFTSWTTDNCTFRPQHPTRIIYTAVTMLNPIQEIIFNFSYFWFASIVVLEVSFRCLDQSSHISSYLSLFVSNRDISLWPASYLNTSGFFLQPCVTPFYEFSATPALRHNGHYLDNVELLLWYYTYRWRLL